METLAADVDFLNKVRLTWTSKYTKKYSKYCLIYYKPRSKNLLFLFIIYYLLFLFI